MKAGVVIVGASIGGLATAEALRAEGYEGTITLLGEEAHSPYSRPSLSKQVLLRDWAAADCELRDSAYLEALQLQHWRETKATGVDLKRKLVQIGSENLAYDHLVIATGSVPRRPTGPLAKAQVVRTRDEAFALRDALRDAEHVAVVGAGVLGTELASAAQILGKNVTLIGRSPQITFGQLGASISERLVNLLKASGVRVILNAQPTDFANGRITLGEGVSVAADVTIAAIGAKPAVEWLEGSGLDLTNGVVCDDQGRAAEHVSAVGDVAAWQDSRTGELRRFEHQQTAIEQGQAVARRIVTGDGSELASQIEPFFWSEICGVRLQVYGSVPPDGELVRIAGGKDNREVLAARRYGETKALIGWNAPREFRLARAEWLANREANIKNETQSIEERPVV